MSIYQWMVLGFAAGLFALGVTLIFAAIVYLFEELARQRRAEKERAARFIKEHSHVHISQGELSGV